jgi:Zn-dependent M28 family amino/carboxypeptidase
VVAPEYGWDDYKDVDVKGKTILMLVNDPAVPDPNDPSKLDEKMFKGTAMTYYGRWTYKYEIASQKGAAAAIIIHETGPAGYPFEVVAGSWGGENFGIQRPDNNLGRVPVEGWISFDKATELCRMAGLNLAALKKAAIQKDFKPVKLPGATASFRIDNTLRKIDSHNVIAKLEGSDPALKNQYVIYTAHWDHLGRDPDLKGDQIYNGADDNATGTAGLLELARAYKKLSPAPKRSILFLSVTAEEQGLLGSEYYAVNPLYPLKNTLADINMDELNQWGKTSDMTLIGLGNSTLDDTAVEVLKAHGRTATGDQDPGKGSYYRSDHFEFAKQGVPALDPEAGRQYVGKPEGYGTQKADYFTEHDYHKPSDEVKPDWDLAGAVEDLRVFFEIGNKVADDPKFPEWKPGTEFKAKRDEMVK